MWDRVPTCPNFQTRVSEFGQCPAAAAAGCSVIPATVAPRDRPLRVSFAKARPARTWPLGQSGSSSSAFTPVPNSGCPSYRSVGNIKANDTMKQRRGRAQRGVERAFRAAPDHQFTTAALVGWCYGRRPLALLPPTCVSASLLGGLLCRCATSAAAATQSALADRVAKR